MTERDGQRRAVIWVMGGRPC